jgi:4-amino-4-deoxychorismate lyase
VTVTILVNGGVPADPARAIDANDRGFQYGDGLFETALIVDCRVRFLDDHLQRLADGCERLGIATPDRSLLVTDIERVVANVRRGVLKIVVTRGVASRGYRPAQGVNPTRVVAVYPAPEEAPRRMLMLRWCETRLARNARLAGIKHLNRLEQVLAQAEWQDADFDEGLMLDTEGELVSATAANVFVVRDGALVTSDLRFSGVRGVLRGQVLGAARQLGIAVSEEPLWPYHVECASEVFLTNSVRGIRSVGALGDRQWHETPVADQLRTALGL